MIRAWLRAVIGSGKANLNPTVVRAILRAAPAGGTTLTLTAIAKEGFIRQHAAEQALEQVEAALDAEPGPHA